MNGDFVVVECCEDGGTDATGDVVLVGCVFVFDELDMEGDLEMRGNASNESGRVC